MLIWLTAQFLVPGRLSEASGTAALLFPVLPFVDPSRARYCRSRCNLLLFIGCAGFMIFSFNIQNFLSIHDLTIDLTPRRSNTTTVDKKRGPFDQVQLLECQDIRTVPVMSILGFNASGKSNVMLAFIQLLLIATGVTVKQHKFYRPCADTYKNQPKYTSLKLRFSYADPTDNWTRNLAEYAVQCGSSGILFERLCCADEEVLRFEDGQIYLGTSLLSKSCAGLVADYEQEITRNSLKTVRGLQILTASMLSFARRLDQPLPFVTGVLNEFANKFFYISPYYQTSILSSLEELDRLIVLSGGVPGFETDDGNMTALRLLNSFLNEICHGDRLEMPRQTKKNSKWRDSDLICVHHGRRDREYRVHMNTESNCFYHSCLMLVNCLKAIVTGGVILIDDINLYQPPVSQLFMQQLFKSSYNRQGAQLICTLNGNKVVIPNTYDSGDEMAYIEKDQQKGPLLIRGFDLCKNSNIKMQGFKMPFDLEGVEEDSEFDSQHSDDDEENDEGVKPILSPQYQKKARPRKKDADSAESTGEFEAETPASNTEEEAEESCTIRDDGLIFVGKGNC